MNGLVTSPRFTGKCESFQDTTSAHSSQLTQRLDKANFLNIYLNSEVFESVGTEASLKFPWKHMFSYNNFTPQLVGPVPNHTQLNMAIGVEPKIHM